jgi:hypothetical protein
VEGLRTPFLYECFDFLTSLSCGTLPAVPFYNDKDVEGIRAACRLGREILDIAHRAVRPGVTTGMAE